MGRNFSHNAVPKGAARTKEDKTGSGRRRTVVAVRPLFDPILALI